MYFLLQIEQLEHRYVLDEELIFLEEWLEKPIYNDENFSLGVEAEMNKVDFLVAEAKEDLNEEIKNDVKEEKNEKNEYSSYYNILCNLDIVYESIGEQPDEEEMNDDVIG